MRAQFLIAAAVTVASLTSPATAQLRMPEGQQVDPQGLQQPLRAPLTITPTITVTEEFDDNINLDNRNREWDLITGITPGISINLESPTYRLTAAYNFTAELFLRDPSRNAAFDRQNFSLSGLYRVNPEVTLTLSDVFTLSTDTNLISTDRVATGGRNQAWSNVLTPGATWQMNPLTTLRAFGSYTILRFEDEEQNESDTYRFDTVLERRLSTRFSGTLGYQFAYFDIERNDTTTAHTPRLGGVYRASPTITLGLSGGPMFVEEGNDDYITPAVTASYRQTVGFGTIAAFYDRNISTAGGLGGTAINDTVGGTVEVITLLKGLTIAVSPQYTSLQSHRGDSIDIQSFTMPVTATYRITAWMAAIAGYQFFHQRSDSTVRSASGNLLATDADQNRVFVGLQFGYPIRFDAPLR